MYSHLQEARPLTPNDVSQCMIGSHVRYDELADWALENGLAMSRKIVICHWPKARAKAAGCPYWHMTGRKVCADCGDPGEQCSYWCSGVRGG